MSQKNLFRIEWSSEGTSGYNFGFNLNDKRISLIRRNGDYTVEVDGAEITNVPASELEDTIRKAKLGMTTTRFFRDDFLTTLLASHEFEVDQNYGAEERVEGDVQLDPNGENLPYLQQIKSLFLQQYPQGSERFRELAFLNNLYFRTAASSDRIRKIVGFATEQSLDGIVITAQGSTSRGLSSSSSDVEISVFDFKGSTPNGILDRFATNCSNNGLEACQSSAYYGKLDLNNPDLIANAFMYACYGDWMQLRRDIVGQCTEEQFSEAMSRYIEHNTIGAKHMPRFNIVFGQRKDGNLLVPQGLELPPTGDYIHSILPTLEETRRLYLE
ncbi:MAG: hypothetical protein KKC75_07290 [Nanoarchaeota archaeon]|nr:hypothetical protein [Nanoarchaeota archaeon]